MQKISQNRRQFLSTTGAAFAALIASGCVARGTPIDATFDGYGPLLPDPEAWANAYLRMRHPDFDQLRSMLDTVGETIRVHAR